MRVLLSLGSNIGGRRANIRAALRVLACLPGLSIEAVSSLYETEPVGTERQPRFLNCAADVETDIEPLELLEAIKRVETRLGRCSAARWGPRVIDIDIILWGSRVIDHERLTVPHREFRNRAFVLIPLAEIAPEAVDPVTGRSVSDMAQDPNLTGRVLGRLPLFNS